MSFFGNDNRNPFGTLGSVIYENRDNLIYAGIIGSTIGGVLTDHHVPNAPFWVAFGREAIRTGIWRYKSKRPKLEFAGLTNHTHVNCHRFSAAGIVGFCATGAMLVFVMCNNSGDTKEAISYSALFCTYGYIMLKGQSKFVSGFKDLGRAYYEMWNYTDNDGTGGHTQRMLNKMKGAYGKATEWLGELAPRPQRQPAIIPGRKFTSEYLPKKTL